jgi:cell division protein FtsI/penicillin-binding protein 2
VSTTRTRIGVLGGVFGAGVAVVLLHLWLLMVQDHETWARRSHENRWSFKAVPSQRGALRDRFGQLLAEDRATTDLALHYVRFRTRHPVGAAVHGATTLARLQGDAGATFAYDDGPHGAGAAMRTLLALPARALRPRVLEKHVAAELASAVTTVLAASTGKPRSRVFAALREAALGGSDVVVGDVLGVPRAAIVDGFLAAWSALHRLDRDLRAAQQARLQRPPTDDDAPGLLATLETLRGHSLAGTRVEWVKQAPDGTAKKRTGSKIEAVQRVFAQHVPFDLAAELRVAEQHFPGIDVLPSVERVRTVPPDGTLYVLLGSVSAVDSNLPGDDWLEDRVARSLPDDWFQELEPPDALGDGEADDERERHRAEVRATYRREVLLRERLGRTGIERAFDDALAGRLGLRLVEHDAGHREQQLWSHLRVEAGDDVLLSIDAGLQHHAEAAAFAAWQANLHGTDADHDRTEAAIALIDAVSGDVLAYAGAPLRPGGGPGNLPGLMWSGNGAIGSVVKPFVLIEQVHAEQVGRPHRPVASLEGCSGSFRFAGRVLRCSHAHWDGGRDAVAALGHSCNLFFYQCAVGLGDDGVARALRRFGLAEPSDGDPFAACWQASVRGMRAARPKYDAGGDVTPNRAIGYGLACSPLHLARAYAALATGALPTLGLELSPRPKVVLDDVAGVIPLVHDGLRHCVERGTANKLPLLRELGVLAKTGTAEVGVPADHNNAWFAGFLPPAANGMQLCFAAVVYWVPHGQHGADAAGRLVVDVLRALRADPQLAERYLAEGGGR